MLKINNVSISIRLVVAMFVSFVMTFGNITAAFAAGTTPQAITFTQPATPQVYGATFSATATTNATGLTVSVTVDPTSSAVCSISGTTVTALSVGTCKLNADQAGDATYAAATTVSRTVTINAKPLSVTVSSSSNNFWSDAAFPTISATSGAVVSPDAISGYTFTYNDGTTSTTTRPTTPGYYTVSATPTFSTGSASNYAVTSNSVGFCMKDASRRSADGGIFCFSTPAGLSGIGSLDMGWDRATNKFTDWVTPGQPETALANQSSGAGQYKGGYLPAVTLVSLTAYYIRPNDGPGNCVSKVAGMGSTTMQVGNGGSGSASINSGTSGWATSNNGGFGGYTGATGTALAINVTYSKPAGNSTYPVGWVVECYAGASGWSSASFSAVQVRPIITAISTNNGYVAGGTAITITGNSFSTGTPAATVTVGGVPCVISSQTATSITCTTGAGTAGLADVVVTNTDGVTGTKAGAFTYAVPATVKPTNTLAPSISATTGAITTPGSTLAANPGTWDTQGDNFTTTTYQWQICTDTQALLCTDVAGATSPSWVSPAAAANRYVRVGVTVTNDAGSFTAYSPISALLDKMNQTITFNAFGAASYGDADVTPSAVSSTGGAVTYTIDPSSTATCSVVAGKIHFTTVGTCVVSANAVETDQFKAATQQQRTLTIGKKALTITPTIASNSFWTTDTFPTLGFTSTGLAAGETITGVTYNFNDGTSTVTTNPTAAGYYTMTATTPVFGVGSADNYTVTSASTNFCLKDGAQKNDNGLAVCFSAPWRAFEMNNLSYGWDAATSKYTTWVRAGQTPTTLANQSSSALQFEGTATLGLVSGIASGYYTPTVNESFSCTISMANVYGTFTASFGGGSGSMAGSGPGSSSQSSWSGQLVAGTTYAISSTYNITATHSVPVAWYFPCSVGGRPVGQLPIEGLSSVIRPTITSVTPNFGLVAGGNKITIAGANFGTTGTTVTIDGVSCPIASTPAPTATSITCTVPAGTEGLADVVVTTAAGSSGSKVGGYSYEAATYPVPTNSVAPVISTSAAAPYAVASSIASTLGTWNMNGDPTTTTTVAWQVCPTAQALLCTDIVGAAGTPWPSTADVAGKYLRSAVTATNNGGTTVAYSNILGPFAKATQSMTVATITNKSVGVADFYPAITYTPATPIRVATLGSTTPSVCTIIDNKIHVVANGTCSITADLAEDETFTAAVQKTASFAVTAPAFTATTLGSVRWGVSYSYQYVYSNPSAIFSVTAGSLPRGLTLSPSGVLSGVPLSKPGTVFNWTVTATDASGESTINSTITMAKGDQIGSATIVLTPTKVGGKTYLAATLGGTAWAAGSLPIVPAGEDYEWLSPISGTPTVCTIDNNGLLTIKAKGICIVQISVADQTWGRSMSLGGSWQNMVDLPAPLKANAITFTAPATQISTAADFALSVKATSGAAPTVTSSTPNVCTVSGITVHMVGVGTCTLSAADASNATFGAAPAVVKSFEVVPGPEAPTITSATSGRGAAGGTALVTFTNGNLNGWTPTGYQVTATPAEGSFGFPSSVSCPTVGAACVVTGLTPGVQYTFKATVLASLAPATAKVDSAPSTPVLVLLPQTIELPSPGVKRPDAGSFPLFPVSDISSSIKPVVTSSTPSVCTVDANNVVTVLSAGTCTLTANSDPVTAMGLNYGAATPTIVSFSVSATAPAVTTVSPLPTAKVGAPVAISNTASAGSAIIPVGVAGTWFATGLPDGLTIDGKSGKISETPTAPGVYDRILVSVKDKAGVVASKPLTMTVEAAPGIVGPSTIAVVAGVEAAISVLSALPGSATIPSRGAWAVTAGTLPAGLTLNPDTGVITGTPNGLVGKTSVTITLTDSAPLSASKVLTFDVAAAPTIANSAATETINAVAGKALTPAIVPAVTPGTAGKPAKGAWTFVPVAPSVALPDGLVFNPDTGAISGTPTVPGNYTFDAVFTDGKGLKASKRYNLVAANPPSIITSLMLPVYTIGTSPDLNVAQVKAAGSASIPATGAWSEVGNVLAGLGLALDPNTGAITGKPNATATKDLKFTVKLTDSAGLTDQVIFTLPVITAGTNKTTLNLPVEIAGGTLITDALFDLKSPAAGSSSMGLPVTYSVTATSVTSCFIDADQKLHIIGTGVCGVTASSGSAKTKNLSAATQSFNVLKRSQVLTVTEPGEVIEGSDPVANAAEATDEPAGFLISARLSSGLDPVYTVVPAKNPDGSDRPANCSVDDVGLVVWTYDMTLTPGKPGYDVNGGKCRIAISHPGDNNYTKVETQFLDLLITEHTEADGEDSAAAGMEPAVSMGLPRTGGKLSKGGVSFTVKAGPSGVTIQPQSTGMWIGPISAYISIDYKNAAGESATQECVTNFGIAARDAKGNVITNPALETKAAVDKVTAVYRKMPANGPKGYMARKFFTNSVTCKLNAEATKYFQDGKQLVAKAKVVRDRRWPTNYKPKYPNGTPSGIKTVIWTIKVG